MTDPLSSKKKSLTGSKSHSCFESAEHLLGKKNTKLSFAFQLPALEPRLVIATEKLDPKGRGKPLTMMANFCPFCGVHLP